VLASENPGRLRQLLHFAPSGKCPYGKFRSALDPEFSEDSIHVLFDRAFGQVQSVSDLFVQLGPANQIDHLLLTKRKVVALLCRIQLFTGGTTPDAYIRGKFLPAPIAVSGLARRSEFNVSHDSPHSCCFLSAENAEDLSKE
jgi:hypothetical protein